MVIFDAKLDERRKVGRENVTNTIDAKRIVMGVNRGFATVLRDVAKSLGKGNGSTLIYCSTRNEVEATAATLR